MKQSRKVMSVIGIIGASVIASIIVIDFDGATRLFIKPALIEYSFEPTDKYEYEPQYCYIPAGPNDRNVVYPIHIPVYVSNTVEDRPDGTVELTISGSGITAARYEDSRYSNPLTFRYDVPRHTQFDFVDFWVKPDANQSSITLNVTGAGIGNTVAKGYSPTSVTLQRDGTGFSCRD